MEKKFKIGDEVIVSEMPESNNKAIVIDAREGVSCVEFKQPVYCGHSGDDGKGKEGHCLWFANVALVSEHEHKNHNMFKSICEDLIYASSDLEISDVFEKVRLLIHMYDKMTSEGAE
mgnify:CR=1 FL=1